MESENPQEADEAPEAPETPSFEDTLTVAQYTEMQLVNLNGLDFAADPQVSVATSRDFRTHNARGISAMTVQALDLSPSIFANMDAPYTPPPQLQKIRVDIPSGNRYVWTCGSYLTFDVELLPPTDNLAPPSPWFLTLNTTGFSRGNGTPKTLNLWTNLLKRSLWTHASRRDIDDVQESAHESYLYTIQQQQDWQQSIGSLYSQEESWSLELTNVNSTVLIPLGVIFPSWRGDRLLPPQLVAGSSFEFTLAPYHEAFTLHRNQAPTFTMSSDLEFVDAQYSISNMRIVLDEREMISSVSSHLFDLSTTQGIPMAVTGAELFYERIPMTLTNPTTIEVPRALSKIERNYSRIQNILSVPVVRPCGTAIDFFVSFLRPPIVYPAPPVGFVDLDLQRHTIGFRNWPINASRTTVRDVFERAILSRCAPNYVTLQTWNYFIGGFYVDLRRSPEQEESGTASEQVTPILLDFKVVISDTFMTELQFAYQNNYYLRHRVEYQKIINVFGNVLESMK
jgi:hypothetical protein